MEEDTADVPQEVKDAAANSIIATDQVLTSLESAGAPAQVIEPIRTSAFDSFLNASHVTYFVSLSVVLVAAAIVGFLLPRIAPPRKESLVPADSPVDDLVRAEQERYDGEVVEEISDGEQSKGSARD